MGLPGWAQAIVLLASLVGAVGLLWTKVVRPLIRIGSEHDTHEARLDDHEQRIERLEDD